MSGAWLVNHYAFYLKLTTWLPFIILMIVLAKTTNKFDRKAVGLITAKLNMTTYG